MIYPPIADLVEKTHTRYSLAIITARRARQLGASDGEYAGKFDEAILKAIDEINDGKVGSRPKNYYFDCMNGNSQVCDVIEETAEENTQAEEADEADGEE